MAIENSTIQYNIASVPLSQMVRQEYRNYQIYTLMDRAIPYLEDGLKPCQRRILYTLWKNTSKGLLKVSSATGLVLTLHPHGPASIEASIVNLAQDFTFANNYPLIDKKGYFGERLETAPAAGRYIECKIGEIANLLLFDDMEQVQMIPNYDERSEEPVHFLPKLPLMLLNGAEGIGTGFSSVIPSFHHKDIVDSMISIVNTGRAKRLKPWFRHYKKDFKIDENGKIITEIYFEEIDEKIFINEIPRGYDAQRIYKHLGKFIDRDYLKDYIDSSVDNEIKIELIFKKGQRPPLAEVRERMSASTSLTPNYTLISERGVKILEAPEEILKIFTERRLQVVQRRYELWASAAEERISRNDEIIRFVNDKHYTVAQKCANRQSFIEYLVQKKFLHGEYLAEMPVYRFTQEEINKRSALISEDKKKVKEFKSVAGSQILIREKLIDELKMVNEKLTDFLGRKKKKTK
ncbi:MAG: hypothetical protein HQK50_14560 [Oligoflexia bacterium]|nr:hypothetical protein [Oligoflexia bacterium]MBF0366793.1 hypothetical protein [Oligoflexia bacterium]